MKRDSQDPAVAHRGHSPVAGPGREGLTRLEELQLDNTAVTDAGLARLEKLPALVSLLLHGTKVTDAAVQRFKQARPQCKIDR